MPTAEGRVANSPLNSTRVCRRLRGALHVKPDHPNSPAPAKLAQRRHWPRGSGTAAFHQSSPVGLAAVYPLSMTVAVRPNGRHGEGFGRWPSAVARLGMGRRLQPEAAVRLASARRHAVCRELPDQHQRESLRRRQDKAPDPLPSPSQRCHRPYADTSRQRCRPDAAALRECRAGRVQPLGLQRWAPDGLEAILAGLLRMRIVFIPEIGALPETEIGAMMGSPRGR